MNRIFRNEMIISSIAMIALAIVGVTTYNGWLHPNPAYPLAILIAWMGGLFAAL